MNYFDNGLSNTADSLAYFRDHMHELGTILVAEVAFPGLSEHYPYCLELRDDHGNRMFLSGVTAGYAGEGPRAAMQVLVEAGFPAADAQRVLCDKQPTVRRLAWRPDPDLATPPPPAPTQLSRTTVRDR